jgi:gamma-glutamylcyclotransferase (GGCT)/AIG2-like uncharacterized protein YtfP
MPRLFSYGTLRETGVQLATFGRRLDGDPDDLPGFVPAQVPIPDPAIVAATGKSHYPNVRRGEGRVSGRVFEITDAELASADRYEEDAAYHREVETLASGRTAWVYRHVPGGTR